MVSSISGFPHESVLTPINVLASVYIFLFFEISHFNWRLDILNNMWPLWVSSAPPWVWLLLVSDYWCYFCFKLLSYNCIIRSHWSSFSVRLVVSELDRDYLKCFLDPICLPLLMKGMCGGLFIEAYNLPFLFYRACILLSGHKLGPYVIFLGHAHNPAHGYGPLCSQNIPETFNSPYRHLILKIFLFGFWMILVCCNWHLYLRNLWW